MQQSIHNLPGKQSGATLVVALIMLLLLSLLGATSLKQATNTERMASAGHQKNITFQASESAAALTMFGNSQVVDEAIDTNARAEQKDVDIDSDLVTADVTVEPLGNAPVLGSSANKVTGIRLMITSTAQLNADPRSQTVTVHGIVRKGPAF